MTALIERDVQIGMVLDSESSLHDLPAENSRAHRWFCDRLKKGRSEIFSEKVRVTPDIAKELLSKNHSNRPLNKQLAKKIALMIQAGEWQFNGESIKVSKEGELNDGQHRCAAIIAAATPVDSIVVFGLDRESRFTVDFTQKRSTSQLLNMDDVRNAHVKAAVARYLLQWVRENNINRQASQTTIEIYGFYQSAKDKIDEAVDFVTRLPGAPIYGSATGLALCYAILRDIDEDDATEFIEKMQTGECKPTSIIFKCREKIAAEKAHATRTRSQYHIASFVRPVFAAWEHYRKGSNPQKFHVPQEIRIPK